MTPGNLYIIHMLGTRYYKLGLSKDSAYERVAELQTGNPFKLIPHSQFKVRDMRIAEDIVHRLFHKQRVRGEWFVFPLAQYCDEDEHTIGDAVLYMSQQLNDDIDQRIELLLLDALCPYCSRPVGNQRSLQKAIEKGYCRQCKNP